MKAVVGAIIFFFALVLLLAVSRQFRKEGFRGGEAIGGHTEGPAASMLEPSEYFQGDDDEEEMFIGDDDEEGIEGFRGGGGEAIGGRTAGPAASMLNPADFLEDVKKKKEGFYNFVGRPEVGDFAGPGPAALDNPREPYHLLSDTLKNAPRDSVGCLTAGCCNETDFEARTNLTGNYLQRTNNYKREYPDNCTGPLHDFTMAFYKTTPLSKQA